MFERSLMAEKNAPDEILNEKGRYKAVISVFSIYETRENTPE